MIKMIKSSILVDLNLPKELIILKQGSFRPSWFFCFIFYIYIYLYFISVKEGTQLVFEEYTN